MNPALLFLLRRSFANEYLGKLRRLKSPRYLVPTLIGLAYFGVLFGTGSFGGRPGSTRGAVSGAAAEWTVTALGILMVAMAWLLPSKGPPLAFLESEVAMLFPAPVTRRELVRYKLLDMQRHFVLAGLLIAIFATLSGGPLRGICVLLGSWLALNLLTLHGIAAKMTRQSLADHGWSGLRRQAIPLGALGAYAAVVVAGLPALPSLGGAEGKEAVRTIVAWVDALGESPAGMALLPFRAVARPLLAEGIGEFLLWSCLLVGVGGVLYLWVMRTDVAFEEAAAAQAETLTRRIEAARRGRLSVPEAGKPPRRNPWRLAAAGPPETAFLWKSVTAILQGVSFRLLLLALISCFVALPIALDLAKERGGAAAIAPFVVASALAGFAVLLVFGGTGFLGANLRQDLEKVEILKALPLTGARLVRASLYGTVVPVAVLQALLVAGAVVLFPDPPKFDFTPAWRLAAAVAGAVGLPSLTALSAAADAGGVLCFPAWIRPGQPVAQGGMEGMGHGIVTALGKALVLGLGLLVPGTAAITVAAAGIALGPLWAPGGVVAGSLVGGALVLAETWALSLLLGRRFERLDPAEEGMVP